MWHKLIDQWILN